MHRFILTGAPGAGKTTVLRALEALGYPGVDEAATEVNARAHERGVGEPWTGPTFITDILDLQIQRQAEALSVPGSVQFFDRSPVDTDALCRYLGFPRPPALVEALHAAQDAGRYERDVFFLENLGFVEPTAVRRISFEDSLRFEAIHAEVYAEWGYRCLTIPRLPVPDRVQMILAHVATLTTTGAAAPSEGHPGSGPKIGEGRTRG